MPAQSSRSIGFLMLVGSSLTLCGIICNNKAMLSPGFLRYDPSKSNYGLLVTIVVGLACLRFFKRIHFKVSTITKLLMWHLAHGGTADFRGRDKTHFNFFSGPKLSVNVLIEDATFVITDDKGSLTVDGTYILRCTSMQSSAGRSRSLCGCR